MAHQSCCELPPMVIASLCKSIASSLHHNLNLATSVHSRHQYASQALQDTEKIVVALAALRTEKGDGSEEYREAREALLDLLTTVCIHFVRSCTDYNSGIVQLQTLMGLTNEELVRRKLASYCNQLKKKWNQIEPGGIHHAPRAAWKRQSTAENALIPALGGVLAVVVIVAGITLFGFNSRQAPTPPAVTPLEATVHTAPTRPEPAEVRPIDTAPLAPTGEGDFCSYTDDNGVIHLVNDSGKVPPRYRSRLKIVAREDNGATHVICDRNRVLVPVKIRYRGREVETTLLMDTGASVTTINEAVASRLGIDENALEAGFSTVADGRRVRSFKLAADDLAVGTKRLPGAMISILPGSGGDGTEGLLGMDFLKEFRHHIDFKRGVIQWGG